MIDDLLRRLRQQAWAGPPSYIDTPINPAGPEAADFIEAQAARIEKLEAALLDITRPKKDFQTLDTNATSARYAKFYRDHMERMERIALAALKESQT